MQNFGIDLNVQKEPQPEIHTQHEREIICFGPSTRLPRPSVGFMRPLSEAVLPVQLHHRIPSRSKIWIISTDTICVWDFFQYALRSGAKTFWDPFRVQENIIRFCYSDKSNFRSIALHRINATYGVMYTRGYTL